MRARNIKPGYYRDADLAECSIEARYIVPGLWMLADREGRMKDKPKQIKMELCPIDEFDIDALLAELEKAGHLIRYEVEGKAYIQIRNFLKHQNPHKHEPASDIPEPQDMSCHVDRSTDTSSHAHPTSDSGFLNSDPGLLNPDSCTEEGGEEAAAPSPENDCSDLTHQDSTSLLKSFQNPTVQSLVEKSLDLIASTRQTGKVAESVRTRFVRQLLQFEEWKIGTAITKYIEGEYWLDNKAERYLLGILRNVSARDYREVVGKVQQKKGQGEREPPEQSIQPTTWAQAESAERRTMAQWLLEQDKGGEDAEQENSEARIDQALDSISGCEARSG